MQPTSKLLDNLGLLNFDQKTFYLNFGLSVSFFSGFSFENVVPVI
jgi:hypothetical protein